MAGLRSRRTCGKYLQNATNDENYTANNPAARIVRNVFTRGWIDDGDFVVECNLANPDLQVTPGGDTCQALAGDNRNFGSPNPNSTIVNPAILEGWGVRPADGQFSVSVQHEVLPRVSLDVSYNRRWFENFFVDDNQLVGPADYYAVDLHCTSGCEAARRRHLSDRRPLNYPRRGAARCPHLPDVRDGLSVPRGRSTGTASTSM